MFTFALIASQLQATSALDFSSVEAALEQEVANSSFPGAVALVLVGDGDTPTWTRSFGKQTYSPSSSNDALSTIFDLASLTKVIGTTTATMMLYQAGLLDLDSKVSDESLLGPTFAANGKGEITVRNLMLHNSGFPPDPVPQFWSTDFNCSQTSSKSPALTFDCVPRIYTEGLMNQSLLNPIGEKYVYSDLSMITMMFVVGTVVRTNKLVDKSSLNRLCMSSSSTGSSVREDGPWQSQCYYEAFLRTQVFESPLLNMSATGFRPAPTSYPDAAPACVATPYRQCPMQGQVSDGNSFAMGGVAGHAGLFSTARDLSKLLRTLVFPVEGAHGNAAFLPLNASTIKTFTTIHNVSQSSRALGWDTNDYTANSYRGCANLSASTWTHTGYTGTQVCCDPTRGLVTVLLTNRCYPDDSAKSKSKVHHARQRFNNAVMRVVDGAV